MNSTMLLCFVSNKRLVVGFIVVSSRSEKFVSVFDLPVAPDAFVPSSVTSISALWMASEI